MSVAQELNKLDFCLLIPCYNNIEGLKKSLASVCYAGNNYKVVIVDDGSTEGVTIENLQQPFIKIQIIRLAKNRGITHALNAGLEWIVNNTRAKYIARLDCGDICAEERFTTQVSFLDAHPDIGLLGSWCFFGSENGVERFAYKTPLNDKDIRRALHLRNVFIHPTVMFRTDLLAKTGRYPHQYPYAEDYAFFWTMLQHTKGAILNQYLVTCAFNSEGLSATNRNIQLRSCRKIIFNFGNIPFLKVLGNLNTSVRMSVPQRFILQLKVLRDRYRSNTN